MAVEALSILIPLYNEEEFVGELLSRVIRAPLPEGLDREIVIVDDCSTDGSLAIVESIIAARPDVNIRLIRQDRNRGKGAAVKRAIEAATGRYSIIQDADLEYDPREYGQMLAPILSGEADVVYGSRFLSAGERRVLYFWHSLANRIVTFLGNVAADVNLTDMETCYKAFRTSLAQSIPLRADGFGIDPEMTVKFARRKARIYETPISYHGRTYEEGKKIGLRDAFQVLWFVLDARFTGDLYTSAAESTLDALSFAPRFNQWMAETILPYVGQTVLEIGAGMGNMSRHLAPRRNAYIATDVREEYVDHLRNLFRHRPSVCVRRLDATLPADIADVGRRVDTVVCLNVLEHIEDDAAALRSIGTLLEPGGRLVLLVPNHPKAYGSIDREIGHYRRYTASRLHELLTGTGYRVEAILHFNRVSMPAWRFTGQIKKAKTLSRPALKMFDRLVWFWKSIDNMLPWEATSIIAIARRS